MNEKNPTLCAHHIFLICSYAAGHPGGLHGLAMMTGAAVNSDVRVSLGCVGLGSFRAIPRKAAVGSCGRPAVGCLSTPVLTSIGTDYFMFSPAVCKRTLRSLSSIVVVFIKSIFKNHLGTVGC